MKEIIEKSLQSSHSYQEYKDLVKKLLTEGKSTGLNQSESLTNYSLLNDKRMKRLDKTIKITEDSAKAIKLISNTQKWLVLTEGWCGDAAQNLPIIHKMADVNTNISLHLVLRDENSELMNLFLTNNGKSIPKLIALDSENNVIFTWGPRPKVATKMATDYKAKFGVLNAQFKQDLQVWYNKDKGISIQNDFIKLIEKSV